MRAATQYLSALQQCAVWLLTDGSLRTGINNEGSGAVIIWPDGEEEELKTPAGRHFSSYRAVMLALASGLEDPHNSPREWDDPIVICTDSMASLATLRAGCTAQTSPLGIDIWRAPLCCHKITARSRLSGYRPTAGLPATSRRAPQ